MSQVNLNAPLIKGESGILMDPSMVQKKQDDAILKRYNERYNKAESAPTPDVKVAYSYILTKAVPPKMKGFTESGLLINQIDVDVRTLKKLAIMSENVADEQEVLLVGHHITNEIVKPGDIAKIDFSRYRRLNDDHQAGVIETSYEIPLYEIDGNEYLILDARDIIYTRPKTK